jgi:carbon-monoxide dehydrogenase medium subunit
VRPQIRYHRPSSLAGACDLLQELGGDASVLAGGTDLLVDLRRGAIRSGHLVSLGALQELGEIWVREDRLAIGALVTPAALEASEAVRSRRPELLDVAGVFGTPQVRNRATVGGNLCTAASCGDLAPLLLVLGARLGIQGPQDRRDLPLEAFFQDHRKTPLAAGEILVEVSVPVRASGDGGAYEAFGSRKANFITVAGVAAFLHLKDEVCLEARIALGAVSPTPILVPAARERLVGGPMDDASIRATARAARAAAAPISDVRGSSAHRAELVEVLCRRTLEKARTRALAGAVGDPPAEGEGNGGPEGGEGWGEGAP